MSNLQTDNSYFNAKTSLRIEAIDSFLKNDTVNVLDCFSGDGKIWGYVSENRDVKVLPIEMKEKKRIYLKGDNLKFLKSINLSLFNVIDLDAYGVPYGQLKTLFKRGYKGVVIVTFIQTLFGCLPRGLLSEIGYTSKMVKKCPTLFNRYGFEKLKRYLCKNKVRKIWYKGFNNKYYLYFKL